MIRALLGLAVLATAALASPLQLQEAEEGSTTYPPGPPEILAEQWDEYEYNEALYDEIRRNRTEEPLSVEIDAFVSRAPAPAPGTGQGEEREVVEYEDIIQELLEVEAEAGDQEVARTSLALELSWWQVAVVVAGCLLAAWLCCYSASCCYLTLDCCSDPYWGCCAWCRPCVRPSKPPPHLGLAAPRPRPGPGPQLARSRDQGVNVSTSASKYSLNENSTAPRTLASTPGSRKSITGGLSSPELASSYNSAPRKVSGSSARLAASEEEERLLEAEVSTLPLASARSVRNYRRTPQRLPASHHNGDRSSHGRAESLPHVHQEGAGSYFSWLFRGRSSKKRYNVSRRVKKPGAAANNNHIYRQTRYRHIAENSRNSAVIPTKIAKRTSTASTYNTRPMLSKRSRSAETVDSVGDSLQPGLEAVSSAGHLPAPAARSRLSANLASIAPGHLGHLDTRHQVPEYNLKYFEKSLMKSKETTI